MRRVRITIVLAGSYLALFVVLLIQALRGEPLIGPSGATIVMLGSWLLATAGAVWFATGRPAAAMRGSAIVLG